MDSLLSGTERVLKTDYAYNEQSIHKWSSVLTTAARDLASGALFNSSTRIGVDWLAEVLTPHPPSA
jgi:hypothetical protein